MESKIFVAIIIVCVVLIIVGVIKDNYNLIINFLVRLIAGVAGIFIMNFFLERLGLLVSVGTNGYTALTVGLLGIPGFLFVYGLAMYFHFTK